MVANESGSENPTPETPDTWREGPIIVVGLGNPGREYADTRHNAGYCLIDRLCGTLGGLKLNQGDASVAWGNGFRNGREYRLAKPLTYMNRSGRAVRKLLETGNAALNRLLVVYDDMALPLGMIRIRGRGSAGGHRGLISIIETLETDRFPRIRIGIGEGRGDAVDHVLGQLKRHEKEQLEKALDEAEDCVFRFADEGIEAAMSRYNRKIIDENEN